MYRGWEINSRIVQTSMLLKIERREKEKYEQNDIKI